MAGIYIHIPFCKQRCIYCDFYSTTFGEEIKQKYVEAVQTELRIRCNELHSTNIQTIYFGGGTPSLLSPHQIKSILKTIHSFYCVDAVAEITLEANPDDITTDYVIELRRIGINRVSLGTQTFSPTLLQFLRRRHTAVQAKNAVTTLFKNGIDNISIDLIYGLPNQDISTWQEDLTTAFQLPISHLSSYALSYETGTAITHLLDTGKIQERTDEELTEMYQMLCDTALSKGFEQYEISNFSRPGFHSRHNSSYWQFLPYLGIGSGAHSYDGNKIRRNNLPDIKGYINNLTKGNDAPFEKEILSDSELIDEFIMLSLRTTNGLSLTDFKKKSTSTDFCKIEGLVHRYINNGDGYISEKGNFCFTTKGFLISDYLISEILSKL